MPGLDLDRNDGGQRYTGSLLTICRTQALSGGWSVFGEVARLRLASERNGRASSHSMLAQAVSVEQGLDDRCRRVPRHWPRRARLPMGTVGASLRF